MKIVTPRIAELVSSTEETIEQPKKEYSDFGCTYAEIKSSNITNSRLTCCCEYESYIICAGFSGELFFVEKYSLFVKHKEKVSNSIIRCIKVITSERVLLVSTDAGEMIVYDLKCNAKQYYELSNTPIYNIAVKNSGLFITSERNGDVYEWEYIPNTGIFRNNKLFSANNTVFAMGLFGQKLVVVNSMGKKYEFDFSKSKLKSTTICESNVFCIKEGNDDTIFYGLANGKILCEELGSDIITLDSHKDAVRDFTFSAKKEWMFSVSKDRTVRAWKNGVPRVLTRVNDYLYQIIFVEVSPSLYYVDGHGDIGVILFSSDIDSTDNIQIINNSMK